MYQIDVVPDIPRIGNKDWDFAVTEIQKSFLKLGKFDNAVELQILEVNGYWNLILHWVLKKKWVKKHQIPGYRADIKAYEPLGQLYFTILELCIQAHQLAPSGYVNGVDWFSRIIRHEKQESINNIFAIARHTKEPPTKTKIVVSLQEKIKALGKVKPQNPFDQAENPHLHHLIEIGILRNGDLAEYWEPFIKAFRTWVREFSGESWNVRYAKDGKIHRTSGAGRNKSIVLYP